MAEVWRDACKAPFLGLSKSSSHLQRILNRSVELPFVHCCCSDVTAECLHQESIIANRQKADFIANVSHELRSPLHGIMVSLELLKEAECSDLQNSLWKMLRAAETPRGMRKRNQSVSSIAEHLTAAQQFRNNRENPLLINQPVKVDLALLFEDVADSVYISRLFHDSVVDTASHGLSSGTSNMWTNTAPVVSIDFTIDYEQDRENSVLLDDCTAVVIY
ncbi:hypothetical protein F5Y19DRAFT_487790 [Xylariaceae sp. FL1651]|nr:hypothetical protein F5Y19DRAFT_487790 [Xylariaceae sp. FL1651]